jgi:hypothetical protein
VLTEKYEITVASTEVLPSSDEPVAEKRRKERGRYKGQFQFGVSFLHGACGAFGWEEIAATT